MSETVLQPILITGLLRRSISSLLGLPAWARLGVFMAIVFLRHPLGILHADFWGEDGSFWYTDAYVLGWRSALVPHTGYLQTISRFVAICAQAAPLAWGPTIFAASALIIQALPSTLLTSRRMQDAWPDPVARLCFALIYVALPNAFEVLMNLTNAQWHLAALAFVIVTIRPAANRFVSAAEFVALATSGVSGPFAIVLLPVAVWQFLAARSRTALIRMVIVAGCVAVQAWPLIATMSTSRPPTPLGAGAIALARIVAFQVILGASFGIHGLPRLSGTRLWGIDAVPLAIALAGIVLGSVALRRGNRMLRQGVLYGALILAAALVSPVVSATEPQWLAMSKPGAGVRYYFMPMLAWIAILLTLVHDRLVVIRRLAQAFLLLMPLGIVTDFYYPGMKPTDFADRAREFDLAPVGTSVTFPVHPPDFQPPMVLTKH
jgi:hypothetical protein